MKRLRHFISLACCLICPALPAGTLYWDADGTAAGNDPASGVGLGGTGNWDQLSAFWFNGVSDIPWVNAHNDNAVFTGAAGMVTLTENIAAGNLAFTNVTGSFVITNATGAETLTLGGTIDTGGGDHTIAAPVVNTAGLVKTGDGRLRLSADNRTTLSGSIAVNGGVISAEAANALGVGVVTVASGAALEIKKVITNAITVSGTGIANGGALRNTANNNAISNTVTLASSTVRINADSGIPTFWGGISGAGNPTLFVGGATTVTLNASPGVPNALNIGAGTLYKDGPNTISVQTPNVYGKTVVAGGTYLYGVDETRLGTVPAVLMPDNITLSNGAILSVSGTMTLNSNRGITLGPGGASITKGSGILYVPGPITGVGSLTKLAAANVGLYLGASNSFQGDLIIAAGHVYPTNNHAVGLGNIVFPVNAAATLAMSLRGFSGVTLSNNIVLNNTNPVYTITPGGSASAPFTLTGGISGTGQLQIIDANGWSAPTVFAGNSTNWTGGLTAVQATVGLGNPNALGTGPFALAPTPVAARPLFLMATVPLTGANAVPNPTIFSGVNFGVNVGVVGTNPLELSGPVTLNFSPILTMTNPAALILSGGISDGGQGLGLTKAGTGTLTLRGNNTYTGGTEVSGGTLVLDCSAMPGPITIDSNGTLAPGTTVRTVTINGDLNLGGNLAIDVNKSLSPSSDLVVVTGTPQNTGTGLLYVNNLGLALAPGNRFTLFNKPLANGSAMQVSGGGALWTNKLEVDGSIAVQSLLPTGPSFSGVSYDAVNLAFNFSVTNGYPGSTYYLLSSTNATLPAASWTPELTNTFDSTGTFSLSLPVSPSVPNKFYLLQVGY